MKKYSILIALLAMAITLSPAHIFAKEEKVESLVIDLVSPQKGNAPQRVLKVSSKPVLVSGTIPVIIPKDPAPEDVEEDRYVVEYFIDGALVYKTGGPDFNWTLDTTQYKNGKHKIIVNYWDNEGPSLIGIKYFIIENPVSIEDLRNG